MTTYKTKLRTYRILKVVYGDNSEKYFCEYRTIPFQLYFWSFVLSTIDVDMFANLNVIHVAIPIVLTAIIILVVASSFTMAANWSTCTSQNCDVVVIDGIEYYSFDHMEAAQKQIQLLIENDERIIQLQQSETIKSKIPL